jgi:hypothetical protein
LKKLAVILFVIVAAVAAPQGEKPLDPALRILSKFVGGKWVADGQMPVEHVWTWNADKRGLTNNAKIGKMAAKAFIGWDPVEKKSYYLDMHGSETTYFGHVTEKNGEIEFRFGPLGSKERKWVERGRFVSDNEWKATLYEVKDGKESAVLELKLKRVTEK